jgi:hypothetical protein
VDKAWSHGVRKANYIQFSERFKFILQYSRLSNYVNIHRINCYKQHWSSLCQTEVHFHLIYPSTFGYLYSVISNDHLNSVLSSLKTGRSTCFSNKTTRINTKFHDTYYTITNLHLLIFSMNSFGIWRATKERFESNLKTLLTEWERGEVSDSKNPMYNSFVWGNQIQCSCILCIVGEFTVICI